MAGPGWPGWGALSGEGATKRVALIWCTLESYEECDSECRRRVDRTGPPNRPREAHDSQPGFSGMAGGLYGAGERVAGVQGADAQSCPIGSAGRTQVLARRDE